MKRAWRSSVIYRLLSRTRRTDWDRGVDHQYVGPVEMEEYGRSFTWSCWSYRTPRTRGCVCVLLRLTQKKEPRVVHVGGVLAARLAERRK